MSRIDPAEFDRLARRRQDARKVLSDAEVKQREATVGVKMAEAEVMKADVDFQDYINQHAPLPPSQPSLRAQPYPSACPPGPHPAKDCKPMDPRPPYPPDRLGALRIDFPRLVNIFPINEGEQTATEVLRRRVAHGYPPPG